jgi:hypothetical protein
MNAYAPKRTAYLHDIRFAISTHQARVQVSARAVAIQFEGFNLGQLTALHQVVIDKTGKFAYPLQAASRSGTLSMGGFQNSLIVEVQAFHRTKRIRLQTPYSLKNSTSLPVCFKVRSSAVASQLFMSSVRIYIASTVVLL